MATRSRSLNIGRLGEIAQVAVRHGFGYLIDGPPHRNPLAAGPAPRGKPLREILDELGPTFVKFGQLLSTRPDIVPPDIIAELRGLQDDVRPFPFEQVEQVVETELALPLERAFRDFDRVALAAASIGQAHRATLPNGKAVAVKVQRPGAPRQIEADLALLSQAARIAKERIRALDFIDSRGLVDGFGRSIRSELDYRSEGRNADHFRRHWAGDPHVQIPRVYWSYTRERVLTLEFLQGIQVADVAVEAYTIEDRRRHANRMSKAWMTMIYKHGCFHGHPHPANILVLPGDRIGLVDFGQTGKLTEDDISKLTRLFIDAANENVDILPRRLADLGESPRQVVDV